MDKVILKKFAIESRKDLMDKVRNKIKTFYVDEEFNSEQKGDIYILSNDEHSLSLTNEEFKKRELLIKRIKELSLEQVVEEAAYTWFNRIIAIRYMEINDYLPLTKDNQSLGIRVLSSKDNTPDPEILKFTNLINPYLDINFKKEKYVELKDDNEKFKYVLLLVCKKLGRVIPQVFDGITDYIDILIPDNLLNDTGFITKIIKEVPENNYNQVEIIGWLYQYWNIEQFNRIYDGDMSRKKIGKCELPAATQLFTPDWVVKYMVDNSLGKYWIENGNNSSKIIKDLKYYVSSKITNTNKKIIPTEIKFLDPCCGSGHILIYAFDLFFNIYLSCGYNKNDIPKLIIENNIYGLDIDERAKQLSVLSLLLKARKYDKNIFNMVDTNKINIHSIEEPTEDSNNIISMSNLSENEKKSLYDLINIYKNAKSIGTLIKPVIKDYSEIKNKLNNANNIFEIHLNNSICQLIKQNEILSDKYDVIVTNPPYLSNARMENYLWEFIKKNYKDSKLDLCTAFIEKALYEFCKDEGYVSFVTTKSWMYIQSFEKIRKRIIDDFQIDSIVDFGTELFDGKIGHLPIVAWVNKKQTPNKKIIAIKLSDYCYARRNQKQDEFFNKNNYYSIEQYDLKIIPGCPVAYWISQHMIENFKKKNLKDYAEIITGMTTGNNNKYLRIWYEVNKNNISFNLRKETDIKQNTKWIPYSKGGNRRKWFGNYDYIVDWSKSTEFNRSKTTLKNLYFKKAITWPFIGGKFSARILDEGFLWDVAGSPCFVNNHKYYNYILGFLNSNLTDETLKLINPTINRQAVDLAKLPLIIDEKYLNNINKLVCENIIISQEDWNENEFSWDFKGHPLIKNMTGQYIRDLNKKPNFYLFSVFDDWNHKTEIRFNKLKENEEKLNEIFIDIYGLKDELTPEVEDKDITIRKADKEREIKSLISYAVGCMFGRYSLDKEGLIYAGGDFDEIYKKCKKTDGGWAGVSLSNYKVLNDNGQEIDLSFEVDNDNVIPITDEAYFSDDIVERFKTFISVVYGEKTLNENLDFIAETLGKKGTETSEDTIRRYFVNDFFNDHVKTYQKRPIYWLFDSGKKNGFKALVYMHRYNENLIPKVRLDYLHRMQTTYEKLLADVNDKLTSELSMTDKKEAQKRQADLNAKLQEIKEYDEKIAHIANQRISIDLDDGVKVNYDKFKDILAKIK